MTLTRREQFAGLAMQGLLVTKAIDHLRPEHVSERAVAFADAIIAELDKAAACNKASDGWIAWGGGECPVSGDTRVEVRLRDGDLLRVNAGNAWWGQYCISGDIIAYRVVGGEA